MNVDWTRDEELQRDEEIRRARGALRRTATIWTPLFVAAFSGALFFAVDELLGGDSGSWFLAGFIFVLASLFGFLGLQALWDLYSEPTQTEGYVTRRWSRTDSLVKRSHFIRLDNRKIFSVDRLLHGDPNQGDRVRVDYFPHSAQVIRVALLPAEPAARTDGEQGGAAPPEPPKPRRVPRKERVERPKI